MEWGKNMEGVAELVTAFFSNDPYYPRPRLQDPRYQTFRAAYLAACPADQDALEISLAFLTGIEQVQAKRDAVSAGNIWFQLLRRYRWKSKLLFHLFFAYHCYTYFIRMIISVAFIINYTWSDYYTSRCPWHIIYYDSLQRLCIIPLIPPTLFARKHLPAALCLPHSNIYLLTRPGGLIYW